MRSFLFKILTFTAICLLSFLGLDNVISYHLRKDSIYATGQALTWDRIIHSDIKYDIYVYGSSRARNHMHPQIISDSLGMSCFNFGIDGHNFDIQHLRHELLIKHNPKPKIIIHSLDAFTLRKRKGLFMRNQFLPHALSERSYCRVMSDFEGFHLLDYYIPLIRYHGRNYALKTAYSNFRNKIPVWTDRINGYKPKGPDSLQIGVVEKQPYEINDLDETTIQLFESYIKSCTEMGIELILVYTPEYKVYQSNLSNRDDILGIYRNLADKYNIEFWDYSDDAICDNADYFFNNLHLNTAGTELFSAQLSSRIKAYLDEK